LTQQEQQEINLNEMIIDIVRNNGPISFKGIMKELPDSVGVGDVWIVLKTLRTNCIIELIKLSNTRVAYRLQYGYARSMSPTTQSKS
jgi:hypothetical protein